MKVGEHTECKVGIKTSKGEAISLTEGKEKKNGSNKENIENKIKVYNLKNEKKKNKI